MPTPSKKTDRSREWTAECANMTDSQLVHFLKQRAKVYVLVGRGDNDREVLPSNRDAALIIAACNRIQALSPSPAPVYLTTSQKFHVGVQDRSAFLTAVSMPEGMTTEFTSSHPKVVKIAVNKARTRAEVIALTPGKSRVTVTGTQDGKTVSLFDNIVVVEKHVAGPIEKLIAKKATRKRK